MGSDARAATRAIAGDVVLASSEHYVVTTGLAAAKIRENVF